MTTIDRTISGQEANPSTAMTPEPDDTSAVFGRWIGHFRSNRAEHDRLAASLGSAPCTLPERERRALIHSFQRFELGEGGDGAYLLAGAERVAGREQVEALRLLVREEQRHSALFGRGLEHLGGVPLTAHWSDRVFTLLRRALGLRTELVLFLTAETVALPYFVALARYDGDQIVRRIGERIAEDEVHHIRFQIDQLRHGFAGTPRAARLAIGLAWWAVAVGAATVVAIDHRAALRTCGVRAGRFWVAALREFRRAALATLRSP